MVEGELNVEGILYGEILAQILGTIEITDVTNRMKAVIQMDPDRLSFM